MSKTKSTKFLAELPCPSCGKNIRVFKESKVISPAQKAEKEEKYYAEPAGTQAKIA